MKLSLTTLILTPLLLAAILVSLWSFLLSSQTSKTPRPHSSTQQPDAWMENVSALILNELGKPVLRIETPRMTHYPEDDTTRLVQPRVVYYRDSPEPWHVNAETATATHGIHSILFRNHVFVRHSADLANPDILLQTESLSIFPDRKEANTADAVKITQPNATIYAVGMSANLNTGIIHLLSDTRSEYVPAA